MTPFHYRCSSCGKAWRRDEARYLCPACSKQYTPGMPLPGVLLAEFDYPAIARQFQPNRPDWSLFTTVEPRYFPPYPVGQTPFFRSERLGQELGLEDVWIKNDGQNPSA